MFYLPLCLDKNHNPRKGTETAPQSAYLLLRTYDKNHNPRKGTETIMQLEIEEQSLNKIRTIIPARGRKPSYVGAKKSFMS